MTSPLFVNAPPRRVGLAALAAALLLALVAAAPDSAQAATACTPGQHKCVNHVSRGGAEVTLSSTFLYCTPDGQWAAARKPSYTVTYSKMTGYSGRHCPCNDSGEWWRYKLACLREDAR